MLDEGRQAGTLRHRGMARSAAQIVIRTLEGAMLVARLHDDPERLEIAADQLLAGMRRPPATESAQGAAFVRPGRRARSGPVTMGVEGTRLRVAAAIPSARCL